MLSMGLSSAAQDELRASLPPFYAIAPLLVLLLLCDQLVACK